MRRYTNRRNSQHKKLKEQGKIKYKIVEEYEKLEDARKQEIILIQKYKEQGQAKFNKKRIKY